MPRGAKCFLLAALCASASFGQATTSLRGLVTDQQGAAIPGAKVTLTQTAVALTRTGLSDEQGVYTFTQLPPGPYTLKAERPGFATLVKQGIVLQVNTPATQNLTLEVGNVSETVSVEASAAQINTSDATVGNAFGETQVRQLPLLTRNVVELLSLQTGVVATENAGNQPSAAIGGQVLGARRDQNNVTLDGADVNDNQSPDAFGSVLPVPLDSVQEFRVTVGGQGANQGRSSGGQVSLVTKGGTNAFHGSLYEFHRNTITSANGWFSNRAGVAREALVRNQFGGSLGGPIKKDRLFFFFNYEQRIDASGAAQVRTVPTESFKAGTLRFRQNNGQIGELSPAEIRGLDPLGQGVAPAMLEYLRQFPAGNDFNLGADSGLNFMGLRFNAPFRLDNKAYVAKVDYKLDSAGNHTFSWRGTLADNSTDNPNALAQFPGQAPASKILNNSRGFAAVYSGVIRPNLVNVVNVGLTRQGIEQSGATGDSLAFAQNSGLSTLQNFTRGFGRIVPVWNISDDLTFIKGKHTLTAGINFRLIQNDRFSFASSFVAFGSGRGTMQGLGSDISGAINTYIRQRSGISTLAMTQPNPNIEAMGTLLGMLTNRGLTYNFGRDGSAIPIGQPLARSFGLNEYEFYVADSWRLLPTFTLTLGIRYGNYQPPFERNGVQVNTTYDLDKYFGQRAFLQEQGTPSNQMPNSRLSYALSGPVNGQQSWYKRDNNNWAPRASIAWAPTNTEGFFSKLFGKGSVIRAGGAMIYDRFGSDMVINVDSLGSVGLSTPNPFPASYNMQTAPRYNGSTPALPASPSATFPFTPPDVTAVAGTFFGIFPSLKTPYSFLFNMNYTKELPMGMTMEVGYAGRLGRKLLLQGDIYTPLNLKDTKSGQDWIGMSQGLRRLYDGGLTPEAVEANPGRISTVPYVENIWPGLRNFYFPGSATANYFYHIYAENQGSDMDGLHLLDRVRGYAAPAGQCASSFGCHTFFALQGSANPTWMNAGRSNYHAMTLSFRRALQKGFGYDFNYTWSHSIDNGSAAESGAGQFGGTLQSVFFPQANRGSSDFDIRHNINANTVIDLPFGKGKKFLSGIPAAADLLIGGWQTTAIVRYRSGLPYNIGGTGVWNTNYWLGGRAIPNGQAFDNSIGYNNRNNPSLFTTTAATSAFVDQYPGAVGSRAVVRGDNLINWDFAVAKFVPLPWGPSDNRHRMQIRAEAFNAFNNVSFTTPSLALSTAATFGEFSATSVPSRVMQFALRYEF
ncbi:MAG: TonB-dependent receptor [Bryobacteraceae bacterium]|nr:TonB-dependent receptor [Bryobacteraceae bacterium]